MLRLAHRFGIASTFISSSRHYLSLLADELLKTAINSSTTFEVIKNKLKLPNLRNNRTRGDTPTTCIDGYDRHDAPGSLAPDDASDYTISSKKSLFMGESNWIGRKYKYSRSHKKQSNQYITKFRTISSKVSQKGRSF